MEGSLEALNGQLQTLNDSLKEVAEIAGKAYNKAVSNEAALKEVRASEKALKDCVAILELKLRALNIKFRGLAEHSEINDNLMTFMMSWISSFLQSSGDASSIITAVYRLGAASQLSQIFLGIYWYSSSPLKIKTLCCWRPDNRGR